MTLAIASSSLGFARAAARGRALASRRLRPALAVGLDVLGQDQLVGDHRVLLDRLALGELDRGIQGTAPLALGVLEHGHVEEPLFHVVQRVGGGVDAADADLVGRHAGLLHGEDGADRHLVVVGGDRVDLLAADDPVGHQINRLVALVVGGLLLNDLDIGILGNDLLVARGALVGGVAGEFA
ncbi:MAG TPA: hypothetical protein VFY87_05290 [Geminicoccaceae bacterium]|nr:hypothetical protein [Geminicoccaceae bacterium]